MGGDTGHHEGMLGGALELFGIGDIVIANISKTGEYVHTTLEAGRTRRDIFYRVSENKYQTCSDEEVLLAREGAFGDKAQGSIHMETSKGCDGKFNGRLGINDIMFSARKIFRRHIITEEFLTCIRIEHLNVLTLADRNILLSLDAKFKKEAFHFDMADWETIAGSLFKETISHNEESKNKLQNISNVAEQYEAVALKAIIDDILLPALSW